MSGMPFIHPGFMMGFAFLCGSIPFGLLIGRAKGIDVRKHGSGNIGASNVGRVLGKKYFFVCFGLDFLKGFVPTLAAGLVLGGTQREAWWWLAVMLTSVLGHVFSPWLKFKGGKGVATALGAMLAVFPPLTVPALAAFLVWLGSLATWRYISVSSILAAVVLPIFVAGWAAIGVMPRGAVAAGQAGEPIVRLMDGLPFILVAGLVSLLVIWTHRGNMRRLRAGTEPKVGQRARA